MATRTLKPIMYHIQPSSLVPNSRFPLFHYQSAFQQPVSADTITSHFKKNGWEAQWQYRMYYKSHYHSTTHEALGIFKGSAKLRFGVSDTESSSSSKAVELNVGVGDVLVISAGVSHRCLSYDGGFMMVGLYPVGSDSWDMKYGSKSEVKRSIDIPIPDNDPVVGDADIGLTGLWK